VGNLRYYLFDIPTEEIVFEKVFNPGSITPLTKRYYREYVYYNRNIYYSSGSAQDWLTLSAKSIDTNLNKPLQIGFFDLMEIPFKKDKNKLYVIGAAGSYNPVGYDIKVGIWNMDLL
jgi:hypothetical protein